MDRTKPTAGNEEIELYIRTYYSLLRSSVPIRLRSLEETHIAMDSSLHYRAGDSAIDMVALVYSALRLPDCFPRTSLVVMGQMAEVFLRRGYPDVESWQPVTARARRRKLYFESEKGIMAAFIAGVSDIDDMIPCMVAYQIEWNKVYEKLNMSHVGQWLFNLHDGEDDLSPAGLEDVRQALELDESDFAKLCQLWPAGEFLDNLKRAAVNRLDIQVSVLGSGLSDYRRAAQLWWQRLEERSRSVGLGERPIYFVSSNTHSLVNLVSGFVWQHQEELLDFLHRVDPENLSDEYRNLEQEKADQASNLLYYVSRLFTRHSSRAEAVRADMVRQEREAGVLRLYEREYLDVDAQIIDVSRLNYRWLDRRMGPLSGEDEELLRGSDALILNIDYPLGMAAYHVFSQVSMAAREVLGVYILGKAATLNGRVGDVMLPNVVYDEHSQDTFLFRNCFTAQDVAPFLNYGTVFDNQKAVTVRGTFLQNREFMHVFYEEGYTDIEMEAGPYLSGIYENIYPKRYPMNEIVNLFINAPYDIGILHYASDTPISRRKTLLSKSLSYYGVDATYATSIAVLQRILAQEIDRQRARRRENPWRMGQG